MSSGHDRPARVASEFAHELGQVLGRGLKDPRINALVTVTGAKMAPDLKDVTAYVSILGDEAQKKSTLEGLKAATAWLQREVARNLALRWTPHLRIVFDESVERGDRIDRLLREARARDTMTLAEKEAGEGEKQE
ncbi:MAG: 30S ribosome-binding factor RbfA [Anaeromyxobacter sp.]|nr:30S ribosome-binding factor RbfA [Anaeromyxobacter sp.]MBL0277301.1 30S ribosome-binding factor RbfA [Anaeromyxobacter sp.]